MQIAPKPIALALLVHVVVLAFVARIPVYVLLDEHPAARPSTAPRDSPSTFVALDLQPVARYGQPAGASSNVPHWNQAEAPSGIQPFDSPLPAARAATSDPTLPAADTNRLTGALGPNGDPRLHALPLGKPERRYRITLEALNDSLRETLARPRDVADWTLSVGDGAYFGISGGIVLHLGHIAIPVPLKAVHMRDVGPDARASRSMLSETREQAEYRRIDSIVAHTGRR